MIKPIYALGAAVAAAGLAAYAWITGKPSAGPQLPAGSSPTPPSSADAPSAGPGTGEVNVPPVVLPGVTITPGPDFGSTVPAASNPTIQSGSTGPTVTAWQNAIGVVPADGIFGPQTLAATKAWQSAHGLNPDGIVGPLTWAAASNGGVLPNTGVTAGASSSANGNADDAFDVLVANAIAKKDTAALEALAKQAQARGLNDVAASIRAEEAAISGGPPVVTPAVPNKPVTPSPATSTGRAVISKAANSKGPDVTTWQKIVGVTADGIFGAATDTATRAWQKTHGLTADGIVGPATWAAAYAVNPVVATAPVAPVVVTTPASRPTIQSGSSGADVKAWQTILNQSYGGIAIDGQFGPATKTSTMQWQVAHGLTADGIVGPKTWAAAYNTFPTLSVQAAAAVTPAAKAAAVVAPPVAAPVSAPAVTHAEIKQGSTGADVKLWQGVIGTTQDGQFGPNTAALTKSWQTAHGLTADGIVGPQSWAKAQSLGVVAGGEHPTRAAALELTKYLQSLGGAAGIGKQDAKKVSRLVRQLRANNDGGKYGVQTARIIIQHGLVPVVPYYWANKAQSKVALSNLVQQFAATDAKRKAQWSSLLADIAKA